MLCDAVVACLEVVRSENGTRITWLWCWGEERYILKEDAYDGKFCYLQVTCLKGLLFDTSLFLRLFSRA